MDAYESKTDDGVILLRARREEARLIKDAVEYYATKVNLGTKHREMAAFISLEIGDAGG